MYQVGQLIIYGGEGVCRVEAVGALAMAGVKRDRPYYTLTPLYRPGRIYTPVDTTVFMRPILSREEAEALVRSIPDIEAASCSHRNPRILGEYYQEMMRTRSCHSMVRIIKMAQHKGQARRARGSKPGQVHPCADPSRQPIQGQRRRQEQHQPHYFSDVFQVGSSISSIWLFKGNSCQSLGLSRRTIYRCAPQG